MNSSCTVVSRSAASFRAEFVQSTVIQQHVFGRPLGAIFYLQRQSDIMLWIINCILTALCAL